MFVESKNASRNPLLGLTGSLVQFACNLILPITRPPLIECTLPHFVHNFFGGGGRGVKFLMDLFGFRKILARLCFLGSLTGY